MVSALVLVCFIADISVIGISVNLLFGAPPIVTSLDGLEKSEKAVVTSGKGFQTSQAVLLPIPANEEVVSHPTYNGMEKGKAFAFSGPKLTNGPV